MSIAIHVPQDTPVESLDPIAVVDTVALVLESGQVFRFTANAHGGLRVETVEGALAVALVDGTLQAIDVIEVGTAMPFDKLEVN